MIWLRCVFSARFVADGRANAVMSQIQRISRFHLSRRAVQHVVGHLSDVRAEIAAAARPREVLAAQK